MFSITHTEQEGSELWGVQGHSSALSLLEGKGPLMA